MIEIEKNGQITLRLAHGIYVMQVDKSGHLHHLFAGAKKNFKPENDFPENKNPDPGKRPNLMRCEIAGCGLGDFRLPSVMAEYPDGTEACDFTFAGEIPLAEGNFDHSKFELSGGKFAAVEYDNSEFAGGNCAKEKPDKSVPFPADGENSGAIFVMPGKPDLSSLPSFRPSADAQTLCIRMRDAAGLTADLYYTVYEKADLITRSVRYGNAGDTPLKLKQAGSLCIDFSGEPLEMLTLDGDWAAERTLHRRPVESGVTSVGSVRGISGHEHNPAVILCSPDTTEETGDCFGFALVYSGNFLMQAERAQECVRFTAGIHPQHFSWTLAPGETFVTPEAALVFSDEGFGTLSRRFHCAIRDYLLPPYFKDGAHRHPVLINSWEACYFDFDEKRLLDLAAAAKESGADLFVVDDGWFSGRNSDTSSLGDWFADRKKLPDGMEGLCEKLNALGMDMGLWAEPEMVSPDSDLFRAHPDWAFGIPGRENLKVRNQLVLDFTRKEVRDEIFDRITAVLDCAPIKYLKYDMNRLLTHVHSNAFPANRQGEVLHRYMLGVYDLQRRITQRYPDLLLENCAAGGGRFDCGMLNFSPQIWCSDNTDPLSRAQIQMGTSLIYPVCAVGSHFAKIPNPTTGRSASVSARMAAALSGTFGFELNLTQASPEMRACLKSYADWYRAHSALICTGDLYRLSFPANDTSGGAWMIAAADKSEAAVFALGNFAGSDAAANKPENAQAKGLRRLALRGLKKDADYRVTFFGEEESTVISGKVLTTEGLSLPESAEEVPGWIGYLTLA